MKLKYRSAAVRAAVILTLGFGMSLPTAASTTVALAAEVQDTDMTIDAEDDEEAESEEETEEAESEEEIESEDESESESDEEETESEEETEEETESEEETEEETKSEEETESEEESESESESESEDTETEISLNLGLELNLEEAAESISSDGLNILTMNIQETAEALLEAVQNPNGDEEVDEEEDTLLVFASGIDTSKQEALAEEAAEDADEDSLVGEVCVANVKNAVNVRKKASSDSTQVGLLYRGAAGIVLAVDGEWTKVSSGDVTGWVKSEYLVTGDEAEELAESLSPQVATVTASQLRVRSGAGTSTTILSVIPKGTELVVESVDGDWVKVKLTSETEGYVYADYVTIEDGFAVAVSAEDEDDLQNDVDQRAAARKAAAAKSSSSSSSSSKSSSSSSSSSSSKSSSSSSSSSSWTYLGTFKITAYCSCSKCSVNGVTASGTVPKAGYTIAVNTSNIALGSTVKIAGLGTYVAEDTGVGTNTIDIYMSSHSAALAWGVHYMDVYVKN